MSGQKMHQTTVRFGADLWSALEDECSVLGVSVAQFVRESALARLMYVSGRRGDPDYELALELAGASDVRALPRAAQRGDAMTSEVDRSAAEISQSSALWAQARQARRRAHQLRDEAERRKHHL
jgi:hypothetical protein